MLRFLLIITFIFASNWTAQAQLEDESISYAIMELKSYSVGGYPDGYWKEKSRIANEKAKLKDPFAEEDFIVVSNSCGLETILYDVIETTGTPQTTLSLTRGISEWCNHSEFKLGNLYFGILENGELESDRVFPIYESEENHSYLLIEDYELKDLKDEGLISLSVEFKTQTAPIDAPWNYNAYDTRVQAEIAKNAHMKILHDEDYDEKYVVFTRGIPLSAFFPEIDKP